MRPYFIKNLCIFWVNVERELEMKKKIKGEIKKIIQTMLEAHTHVMNLLENKCIADANNLLAQCQECAVHIGETIEKEEGMDTKAVFYLETYCELLYEISKSIDKKKCSKLKKQLDCNLQNVVNEINEKIVSDKIKIVFMPYKVSMWDCMETVWAAAEADEECEVFVVPLPYYERDNRGKLEKYCYEGENFPEYVTITHYEKFSLNIEHPDIIYIHNPYDGGNYVTSVHPDYYSSNLKKYTDKLIYIPYYFMGKGKMPEIHRSLPSYQYVDKIIVQDSEKGESLLDYMPKEKILVMGSPKIQRLLLLESKKKEIVESYIPQEWREKIRGKKVIFFNVSITGILQNSANALKKIRYVLSEFDKRADVVLLWRPHPLIEATLRSMRPEMYKEFMEIKNTFLQTGRGIYDETADVGISTVISDAYLGENSSSIVHYFGVLRKPVFYIDWTVLENRQNRDFLEFLTFFKEKNSLFFVPENTGLSHDLYQMDLETGTVERVMTFPGLPNDMHDSYIGIKKVQNSIILIPYNTEDIYIYDIEKKQGKKLVLNKVQKSDMLFSEAIEYKDKLFLIPQCYPAVVSLNVNSLEVQEYEDCVKPFLKDGEYIPLFIWAYFKKEQYLYLASCNNSKILIFNMEDGSFEIKKIGNYLYGYTNMIFDGESFWLAAYKKNRIVRWKEETGETEEYTYPITENQKTNEAWSTLLNFKDDIIVCYGHSIDVLLLDKKTGEFRNHKGIEEPLDKVRKEATNNAGIAFAKFIDPETVVMFMRANSSIFIWNIYSNQWKCIPSRFKRDDLLYFEKRNIEKYYIEKMVPYSLKEGMVTVSQYIDYILSSDVKIFDCTYEPYDEVESSSIGCKIHKYIKNF